MLLPKPMLKRLICLLSVCSQTIASAIDPGTDFYSHIQNICAPTETELRVLQDKILQTDRPILERMPETGFIPRGLKFLSDCETAEYRRLFVHSSEEEKENCIILFSSFNQRYPLGVRRLTKAILDSDYKGHLCYRIGGWPNIEEGDLRLIHVPFAFKPCFFKEMQRLGYKRVLWLDSSILPVAEVGLNKIFDLIAQLGVFIQENDHTIEKFMNEDSARAFGITLADTKDILSCSAAIIGLDLTNPKAVCLLDAWYKAAEDPFAFFSDRSDQNALSILIHQMGFSKDLIPRNLLGSLTYPHGLFIMDRSLVKDN